MEDMEKDMKPRFIEDLGMRFPTETSKRKATYGLFECQYCKKEFECIIQSISSGNTKSCGCQRKGINKTHGLGTNRFYDTWRNMKNRCTNPSDIGHKNYGERGITVCEEWLDVRNFITWCESTHPNVKGVSLDRIDNDKGYSPENCRWADKVTQAINQRIRKDNTSGYVGVIWHNKNNNWLAQIKSGDFYIYIGSFKDKIEAVLARDNYIIENSLPHKLSILNTGI